MNCEVFPLASATCGPKKYFSLPMEREIFGWMDFSGVSRIPRGHWTTCSCHSHGGRERQVFIQDFRIKKNQHFKGWFRQQDRGPIGVLLFPGLEWDWKRVYDRAHEPTVRSTESLFWAFTGVWVSS